MNCMNTTYLVSLFTNEEKTVFLIFVNDFREFYYKLQIVSQSIEYKNFK